MDRRTFFGTLAAAIAARKIPVEPIKLAPIFPSTKEIFYASRYMQPYALGFKITQELMEDDTMYSKLDNALARSLYNNIDDEILRRG